MAQDCGLNLGKLKGSLAKSTGRTGIFDSGPSDRDLADQIGSAHILIGAVDSGSSGSGRKGERPAAGVAGDGASAAEGSPEWANPVSQGLFRRGLGSGMANTLCVIHLGPKRRSGRLGAVPAWTAAGLRGGAPRLARSRVSGVRV